jgi:molecular chaperone GrpE
VLLSFPLNEYWIVWQVLENQNLGADPQSQDGPGGGGEGAGAAEPQAGYHEGLPMEPPPEAARRLQQENSELRDQHLRLAAEFDNFRKRAARERIELGDRAQAGLAVKLLDVLDDLDRVVEGGASRGADPMQQAVVLIDRKLRKELEAAGLERIDPVGKPFDPSLHEAVSVVAPPDPALDHAVSATFQVGYRFKGSLIRPARVQVFSSEGHA